MVVSWAWRMVATKETTKAGSMAATRAGWRACRLAVMMVATRAD